MSKLTKSYTIIEEFIPNFHRCLHKELRNDVEFCHYHGKEIHATLDNHDKKKKKEVLESFMDQIVSSRFELERF